MRECARREEPGEPAWGTLDSDRLPCPSCDGPSLATTCPTCGGMGSVIRPRPSPEDLPAGMHGVVRAYLSIEKHGVEGTLRLYGESGFDAGFVDELGVFEAELSTLERGAESDRRRREVNRSRP